MLFARGGRGFADGNVMGAFSSGTDEGTRVDFRIALGGVANRSAARYVVEGTTVGRSVPVQSTPTVAPTTGIFCIEEMTATFCKRTGVMC